MADTDTTDGLVEVVSADHLNDMQQTETMETEVETDVNDEDILSQALVDVSEFPDGVEIHYHDEGEVLPEGTMITSNNDGVTFITSDNIDQVSGDNLTEHFVNGSYQVLTTGPSVSEGDYSTMNEEISLTNGTQVDGDGELGFQKIENDSIISVEQSSNVTDTAESIKSVMSIPDATGVNIVQPAPLGSSQNPIRIIQQGNQYTPVQQLSTDQLQQIMQVVQQQQMTSSFESGSSVLFNPQTNTRIVYRVIYPSELHRDTGAVSNSMQTVGSVQTSPKKIYKKRIKEEETDTRDTPSLSKEEKEMRKKVRAKTRSGRVSKPPKHMVKDFKHIHVLDYDEDYDDSDGGYSDYKVESGDEEDPSLKDDNEAFMAGLNSNKPRNWKCVTCGKAYIGRAGLGRHLKLNPSHRTLDMDGDGDMVPPPPGSEVIMNGSALIPDKTPRVSVSNGSAVIPDNTPNRPTPDDSATTPDNTSTMSAPNGSVLTTENTPSNLASNGISNGTANSTASLSEDSRDSSYSLPYTPTPVRRGKPRGRPRISRGWRGRGAYNKVDPEIRRRNRLKDLVKDCTDEELMEVVLPRLAKVITLWEFLLMKVEKGDPAKPHADDVYTEYEKLHHYVKKLCQEYLHFLPETDIQKEAKVLRVDNEAVAKALGLQTGIHKVKEISDSDSCVTYRYKFLTTNHSVDFDYTNKSFLKRTVEVVSPEQIVSPTKKMKNGPVKVQIPDFASESQVSLDTKPVIKSAAMNSASSDPSVLLPTSTVNTSLMSLSNTKHSTTVTNTSHTNLQTTSSYPKVVSLLSNSIVNRGVVPIQPKPAQSSQKYLIVSGRNSNRDTSVKTDNKSVVYDGTLAHTLENIVAPGYVITAPPSSSEHETKTISIGENAISSQRIILQTGENVSLQTPIVPQSNVLPISSSECDSQVLVSLAWSSEQSSILSTNVEITTNTDTLSHNQTESSERMASDSQDSNTVEAILDTDPETHTVLESAIMTDNVSPQQSEPTPMFTNESGESQPLDTNPDEISFTVNSEGMFSVTETQGVIGDTVTENIEEVNKTQLESDTKTTTDESSVINRQDSSEMSVVMYQNSSDMVSEADLRVNENSQLPPQYTSDKFGDDTSDPTQEELYQYEENSADCEQVETIQIPARNIFQTEDGAIFIQNQDGTFIQLQSSDGQNVSMETVQALLANEGDTELLEEQE